MALEANQTTVRLGYANYPAMDAYEMPVAVLVLDARGVEFLIENLPYDDGMTKDLIKLRERAKEELWTREAS